MTVIEKKAKMLDVITKIKFEIEGIADEDRTQAEKNIWHILESYNLTEIFKDELETHIQFWEREGRVPVRLKAPVEMEDV